MPYLMEITITKDGSDTVMHLVNSGFSEDPKKDETYKGTVSGWTHALTTMKVWLEQLSGAHAASRSRRAAGPHTPEQLRPLYATARAARAGWRRTLPPPARCCAIRVPRCCWRCLAWTALSR